LFVEWEADGTYDWILRRQLVGAQGLLRQFLAAHPEPVDPPAHVHDAWFKANPELSAGVRAASPGRRYQEEAAAAGNQPRTKGKKRALVPSSVDPDDDLPLSVLASRLSSERSVHVTMDELSRKLEHNSRTAASLEVVCQKLLRKSQRMNDMLDTLAKISQQAEDQPAADPSAAQQP
jgi:hypothetical protein